ncbi:MAG: c-type cytochrome biogenesis protein CcmF [Chromatiales bacterium]|jgi:cytochrome c-type biogenesis protein CcmF|nr:c-type cytochrome biogenesis protein CcmF [Chromatiales bacterium]MDP6149933.1 heme lyase CcmF/NrfE family subunit [Gammaproteobacteria bacterium]MDP7271706.1 heme lyase CcmF/NrfE family subunit [Gammaproteobacteria bacterium]HJP03827.1 heme lyase CcmF/NrfE family subunit [Gammaproteobacteria bacterium]
MIPEFGHIALVIALCIAVLQSVLPMVGAQRGNVAWIATGRPLAHAQFLFLAISFGCLMAAFLQNDFSVEYVAKNSNTALPTMFKVAAVWGAHEGSLLLWSVTLGLWTSGVAVFSKSLPNAMVSRVLAVMGVIAVGFMLFILLTSNPFDRLFPAPFDGADLNPLLQDPALIIHPPMLYMGYVGFSVPFGFAIAAMLAGNLDQQWARWTRPWTATAWLFLTMGIALGSWWAYYELGWGGWWFWDPVENAAFMPWLVGTGLMHSLAVTEKRGLFKSWTLLMAIAAFSLSLLGTFLVRSGVLVSVHAFAADPARGLFILIFLGIVIGTSLTLYAYRASSLETQVGFTHFSRETFILLNSILLVIAAGVVLLGTLGPLVFGALDLGSVSVGPQYFELVFLFPMLPLLLAVGVGMHTAWRSANPRELFRRLRWPALGALVAGMFVPWLVFGSVSLLTALGVTIGLWTVIASLIDPAKKLRGKGPRITRSMVAMQLAHLGLGLTVLGITVTSAYTVVTDEGMKPGETVDIAGYTFRFEETLPVSGPNYEAIQGVFTVSRNGAELTQLRPEKRVYRVQTSPMTEAGIKAGWGRDLFIALGEQLGRGAWSVRIQYKPLIRFIWFGCIVMAIGGLVGISDPRYRQRARAKAAADGVTATA